MAAMAAISIPASLPGTADRGRRTRRSGPGPERVNAVVPVGTDVPVVALDRAVFLPVETGAVPVAGELALVVELVRADAVNLVVLASGVGELVADHVARSVSTGDRVVQTLVIHVLVEPDEQGLAGYLHTRGQVASRRVRCRALLGHDPGRRLTRMYPRDFGEAVNLRRPRSGVSRGGGAS